MVSDGRVPGDLPDADADGGGRGGDATTRPSPVAAADDGATGPSTDHAAPASPIAADAADADADAHDVDGGDGDDDARLSRLIPFVTQSQTRAGPLVPPLGFALVTPGIYRSGFPNRKNGVFLAQLRLRSVLYLAPEDYAPDMLAFYADHGIRLFRIPMQGNKEPFAEIDGDEMARALVLMADPQNRPMLVHCNKGKYRVGCAVGCLRKCQRWSLTAIFDEYRRYTANKVRAADQEFIEVFDVTLQPSQPTEPTPLVPVATTIGSAAPDMA